MELVFIRDEYRNIFIESIKFCQKEKGLLVGAWCIVTSHVHMIIGTNGENKLEGIIRDLKLFTSRHIRKEIETSPIESRKEWLLSAMYKAGSLKSNNKDFQFWQQDNRHIQLSTNGMIDQRLDYIHNNPVEEGLVAEPEHYLFSSAMDYAGKQGLLKIELIS